MVKTETLKLYGVPASNLKEYRAPAKKGQYAFENTPEEKYRLTDEEIPCQNDMLKQQKKNKNEESKQESQLDNDPEDFEFEGRSSIIVGASNMRQPGGDGSIISMGEMEDLDGLDDNLTQCLSDLSIEDPLDQFKKNQDMLHSGKQKRKLTVEEHNDLRDTQLVRKKNKDDKKEVSFEDFNFLMVIGRGTFGKVFLAEYKETKQLYAIKSIRKDVLIQYDQVDNTILEKDIMFECDHPFLVGMEFLF